MDDSNPEPSTGSRVLTAEQLRRLQDLQRRRQQLQKAQDERDRKKKKKSKKTGKNNEEAKPESEVGEQTHDSTPVAPDSPPTQIWGQLPPVDVDNRSFTTSKELEIPEDNVRDERETEGTIARSGSNIGAATQQALALKDGGGGGGVAGGSASSATSARRKRRKLYWGLDSKERWERKSNM